jgi:type III secretion protein J
MLKRITPATTQRGHAARAVLLLCALLAACSVNVAQDLAEADANRVIGELSDHAIGATKHPDPTHEGRYLVEISEADLSPALAALNAAGLPPEPTAGVLEALGESGLVPSRKAEQARLVVGTAGELERSLGALTGVVSARVHLSLPERDPLAAPDSRQLPSASVLLRHRGPTPPLLATDVQRLVAGAVGGLTADQVVVVYNSVAAASAPAEGMVRVGPLTLSQSSVRPLRTAVAVTLALLVCLVGALLVVWLRGRGQSSTARVRAEEPS